jgi:hypothetical protein
MQPRYKNTLIQVSNTRIMKQSIAASESNKAYTMLSSLVANPPMDPPIAPPCPLAPSTQVTRHSTTLHPLDSTPTSCRQLAFYPNTFPHHEMSSYTQTAHLIGYSPTYSRPSSTPSHPHSPLRPLHSPIPITRPTQCLLPLRGDAAICNKSF